MSPRFSDLSVSERVLSRYEIDGQTGCWEWKSTKSRGYGVLKVGGRKGKTHLAHRLSFEIANGGIPLDAVVCHRCDNPGCINPAHLFVGSQTDNMSDMIAKGRKVQVRGVESGRAKLTEEDVLSIRAMNGMTLRAIAKQYGVSHVQILKIRSGESWAHLNHQGA